MPLASLFARIALCLALGAAQVAAAQGLRPPERGEPGLDPSFARGWLAPDYDQFGFAHYSPWRDPGGISAASRLNMSYSFGQRGHLGMSVANNRDFEQDRQVSLFGRYLFSPAWSFSAEMSRDSAGLRPQDFRFGFHRRF